MSDDLIKRLQDACCGGDGCKCTLSEAADRIEELERALDFAIGVVADSGKERGEAEAKLAKAVEALREIAGSVPYADNPWHIALAALAELEGGE
jgi:hypothetical protein